MNFNQIKYGKNNIYLTGGLIDPQASTFYNRVIADGGIVPTGLIGVSATFKALKLIYGVNDISTIVSIFYDAHYLGYKLGVGTGVTLNQSIEKLYSAINSSGDAIQTTLASQPLLLAHNGINYYYGSGVLGNYCSTPDAAANQIVGNTEIIAKVEFNSSTTNRIICSKWGNTVNLNFLLYIASDSKLWFNQSFDGITEVFATSSAAISTAVNTIIYIKVTRVRSTGVVTFFTSSDGITYTQLGTPITSTAGDRFNNITQNVNIAAYANGIATPFTSALKIYQVTMSKQIGGAPLVDFNPQSYLASTSQTQWTSTTGEVWTINTGTATTGYKGTLVDKTLFQADGVNDSLVSSTFSNTANITDHLVFRQMGWVSGDWLYDGTTGAGSTSGLQQTGTSPNARFEGVAGGLGVSYTLNTTNASAILGNSAGGSVTHYKNNVLAMSGGTKGDPNGISLMMRSDSASFGNGSILTFIRQIGQPDSTVRTAVYSFIKTLNNNF
jgi:hypothetical protein